MKITGDAFANTALSRENMGKAFIVLSEKALKGDTKFNGFKIEVNAGVGYTIYKCTKADGCTTTASATAQDDKSLGPAPRVRAARVLDPREGVRSFAHHHAWPRQYATGTSDSGVVRWTTPHAPAQKILYVAGATSESSTIESAPCATRGCCSADRATRATSGASSSRASRRTLRR